MPKDEYGRADLALMSTSADFEEITPSDSEDLERLPKYIKVGATGGTVVMVDQNGNQVTEYAAAGQAIPARPARILATGTTATPINAYY